MIRMLVFHERGRSSRNMDVPFRAVKIRGNLLPTTGEDRIAAALQDLETTTVLRQVKLSYDAENGKLILLLHDPPRKIDQRVVCRLTVM